MVSMIAYGPHLPDIFMARTCYICEKGSLLAGGYSNRVRATKYNPTGKVRRQPNLQWAKLAGGQRVQLCTKCIKKEKNLTKKI